MPKRTKLSTISSQFYLSFLGAQFIVVEESHSSLSLYFISSSILLIIGWPGTYTFLPFFNIIMK